MPQEPIETQYTGLEAAVIGMAGRFPKARNIDEFRQLLENGTETITFFTAEELEQEGVDPELIRNPDYVPAMGYLDGIQMFDCGFFDYTPVEAELMDPQLRIFHECAWEALEDAGYDPSRYDGIIGLYAGAANSFYWKSLCYLSGIVEKVGLFELDRLADSQYLCSRVAYRLDLKGPVVYVHTACSTSLTAIHLAYQGLLSGESDIVLAGGVSVIPFKMGYLYQEGMILSPDGHCRAFDDNARGTVGANGAGIVVLKRLEEAIEDHDQIYAIIKGSAINNDGLQKIGFTAPSVEGQSEVIKDALRAAQVEPESIQYVEAHGTGTTLGDPVELEALILGFNTQKKGYCALGSVKSNFGHLDSAAGVTGLIKTVLSLKYRMIPPTLHFQSPNSKINLIDSPFYINSQLMPWEPGRFSRRAGVSSLGLGGTNVHVILEEAPLKEEEIVPSHYEKQILILSARTPSALTTLRNNLSDFFRTNNVNLAHAAFTLQMGRKAFKHRWAGVCSSIEEAITLLSDKKGGKSHLCSREELEESTEPISILSLTPEEIANQWLHGKAINWDSLYEEYEDMKPHRISLPTYPFEGKRYWIEGPLLKLGEGTFIKKTSLKKLSDISQWFYRPSWKRGPALLPVTAIPPDHKGKYCIIFYEDHELSIHPRIISFMKKINPDVIMVTPHDRFEKIPGETISFRIDPSNPDHYNALFEQLFESRKIPATVIHLWTLSTQPQPPFNSQSFSQYHEKGCYSLILIARALQRTHSREDIRLIAVTSRAASLTGDDLLNPQGALIHGLVKVISQEYPNITGRSVDIAIPDSQSLHWDHFISQLVSEFCHESTEPLVLHRGTHRWITTYESIPLQKSENGFSGLLKENGVYLIIGGLGNIGYVLARYLAKKVHARLILVSRTPLPDSSKWDAYLSSNPKDDPVSTRIIKIKQLERLGVQVLFLHADVGDAVQLENAFSRGEACFGSIDGVFHAAGDMGESLIHTIEHLEKAQCEAQFQARVYGVLALHSVLENHSTHFCCIISSLVSVLGGLGFAAYTAAASFVDTFVHFHNSRSSVPWFVIDTAEWLFNNRETPHPPHFYAEEMLRLSMTVEEGEETFDRILSSNIEPQVIISTSSLQERIDRWVRLEPLHRQDKTKSGEIPAFHDRPELSSPYAPPATPGQHEMVEIWEQFFGIKPIGIDDNFFELGGDSLKVISLVARIHKVFNVKVSIEEFFRHPDVRDAALLIEKKQNGTTDDYTAVEPVEECEYYPLSSAQKRLYFMQQMNPSSVVYNLPFVVHLKQTVGTSRLEELLNKLAERHESLRTVFITIDDQPYQKILPPEETRLKVEYIDLEAVKDEKEAWSSLVTNFIRPFDLSQAPLIRAALVKFPGGRYTWMGDIHHIISDGISQKILSEDFLALYEGRSLPPLRIGYKDFSSWQNRSAQSDRINSQEKYWLDVFHDAPTLPRVQLPIDFPRPEIFTFAGDQYCFKLDEKEIAQLRQFCLKQGATLFMSILEILDILFHKYTLLEDISIGCGVSGRRHDDIQRIIGMFVNTLVIRNFPIPGKTGEEFLHEVIDRSIEAFENQDVQFEELVEKLDIDRNPAINPLFDICMLVQNYQKGDTGVNLLAARDNENEEFFPGYLNSASRFDMTFFIHEWDQGIYIDIEYYTGIFKRETIDRLASHFRNTLTALVTDPGSTIRDIDILSFEEKDQVLFQFNQTTVEYPRHKTVHLLFDEQAVKNPGKIVLTGPSLLGEFLEVNYSRLKEESDRFALILQERGVEPHSIVALKAERCIETIVAILGILKAGAAYLPIEPDYPSERIQYMLKDSNATLFIQSLSDILQNKENTENTTQLNKSFSGDQGAVFQKSPQEDSHNLCYIIYTSGTTGKPKGVMVEHHNVTRLVQNNRFLTFRENDRLLQTGALAFDASTFEIWGPLLNNACLILLDKDSVMDFHLLSQALISHRISIMWMTSGWFNRVCQWDIETGNRVFAPLRVLLVGGDIVSPFYINNTRERFPELTIINGYGPTENTTFSTTCNMNPFEPLHLTPANTLPIGKPISNSTAYILDKSGNPVPFGAVGELVVGGDGIARGYLNNPELTFERFGAFQGLVLRNPPLDPDKTSDNNELLDESIHSQLTKSFELAQVSEDHYVGATCRSPLNTITDTNTNTFYKTGDLARWLDDGNIEFLGRIDQQVKVRGFRIELEEIEYALLRIKEIKEVVVIIQNKEASEAFLCAYFVPDNSYPEIDSRQIKEQLQASLPDYMIPTYFIAIDHIPLTLNGKVDRRALPQPQAVDDKDSELPRDEIEINLARVWGSVLEIERPIRIDENFFELGGHSLKAMILSSKMYKEWGIRIPLTQLFKAPTIRSQRELFKEIPKENYIEIQPVPKQEYYPCSFNQQRLFIIQQVNPRDNSYNMPGIIHINKKIDQSLIRRIVEYMTCIHESLRTGFKEIEGHTVQFIVENPSISFSFLDVSHHDVSQKETQVQEQLNRFNFETFRLDEPPLFRSLLIKIEEARFIYAFVMHHIISDGWSFGILERDFMRCFDALEQGRNIEDINAPQITYKDFAAWHNRQLEDGDLKKLSREFWFQFLTCDLPPLLLPRDFEYNGKEKQGASYRFVIPQNVHQALTQICFSRRITLFFLMYAAYNIFLSQFSGQKTVVSSIVNAGRDHPSLLDIVGFFVNSVVFRKDIDSETSFIRFALDIQQEGLEFFRHQNYPLELVLDEAGKKYPEVTVSFNMVNTRSQTTAIDIENLESVHIPGTQNAKFDLEPYILEYRNGIEITVSYDRNLFKAENIEYMMEQYRKMVEFFAFNPEKKLSEYKNEKKRKLFRTAPRTE